MAFQREVGVGSNRAIDYRDGMTKFVTMMTSRHMEAVVINAGGVGYVVGEIVTVTHAGAFLDFRAEVLTEAAGVVTSLLITSSGAFADRVATVVINAGGTGYVVGDILEIQGGSSREPAKAVVDTEAAGVITAVSVFETGGVYSTPPLAVAAPTLGIGPSTFAGDDAATIDTTMTGIVGTVGLATTSNLAGTGLTVDVTLVESGWAVDGRNTNDALVTVDFEKTVVLLGDAAGKTNKPFVGMRTWSSVSGPNTRYGIAMFMMAAHNPAIAIHLQPLISPAFSGTGAMATASHLIFDEDQVQENDFWITVDDMRVGGVVNINPGAGTTDDGRYFQWHIGLLDNYGTEIEQPYSGLAGASAITIGINPDLQTLFVSSIAEQAAATSLNTGWFFFQPEDALWRAIINSVNGGSVGRQRIMYPMGFPLDITDIFDEDNIATEGVLDTFRDWSLLTRAPAPNLLMPVFSNTQTEVFLWPLNVVQKTNPPILNRDGPKGEVRGFFFLTATDAAGAQIANFSEDFITIGTGPGSRYRVFHNHVHTERYQYIAIQEDV